MRLYCSSVCLLACITMLPSLAPAQEAPSSVDFVAFGDMRIARDHVRFPAGPARQAGPAATDGFAGISSAPWPAGTVAVVFLESVSEPRRALFFDACATWAPAGVRCVPRTVESRWLNVDATSNECTAIVGALRQPNSNANLGDPACWERPRLIHMIGHVLGLLHEHQRADRDRYIRVFREHIDPRYVHEFDRLVSGHAFGEYDFDSVMHYAPSVYSLDGRPTMEPGPPYAARGRRMGLAQGPSALDIATLAQFYGPTPRSASDRISDLRFTTEDFLAAASELHRIYYVEMERGGGISIDGKPDFLAIAAWIFDVYLNARASGYSHGESLYNMRAAISHTEEWRVHNPNLPLMALLPTFPTLRLDRGEFLQAMYRLDDAYRTELLRRDGLSIDFGPDMLGIAAWIFDVYLNARIAGRTPDDAWEKVIEAIRASDEYRQKHPA
jgi:hypothetical protein